MLWRIISHTKRTVIMNTTNKQCRWGNADPVSFITFSPRCQLLVLTVWLNIFGCFLLARYLVFNLHIPNKDVQCLFFIIVDFCPTFFLNRHLWNANDVNYCLRRALLSLYLSHKCKFNITSKSIFCNWFYKS